MPKFTRANTVTALTACTLIALLAACTDIAADVVAPDAIAATSGDAHTSLSAVRYGMPVCFAGKTGKHDSVLSLHKDKQGRIIGKTFGVKKVRGEVYPQAYEQDIIGRFTSNHTIKADVTTQLGNRTSRRSETLKLSRNSVELGNDTLEVGDCRTLVNDFLDRDIERRRQAEKAAKEVF